MASSEVQDELENYYQVQAFLVWFLVTLRPSTAGLALASMPLHVDSSWPSIYNVGRQKETWHLVHSHLEVAFQEK